MFQLCSTCLCKDRRLVPLKYLEEVLISLNWLNLNFDPGDHVCWECKATFTKIYSFREQALRARALLKTHTGLSKPLPQNLSKLSISTKDTYDEMLCYDVIKAEISLVDSLRPNVDVDFEDDIEMKTEVFEEINITDDYVTLNEEHTVPNTVKKELKKFNRRAKSDKKLQNKKLPIHVHSKNAMSKDEKKFIVKKLSLEELNKTRELDKSLNRYMKCPYKCVKCITGYFSADRYNYHVEKHHLISVGNHVCPVCEVRFKRQDTLDYHHDCHFRSYQCRQCNYEHHRLNTMLIHMDKEHEIKKFDCKNCNKGFLSMRQLRYHNDKYHKAKPECNVCGKTFTTASTLKHHISRMHESSRSLQECPTCGGLYRHVRSHMRTHDAALACEDAYCAECDRQYKNVYVYRRHLATNLKHRPLEATKYECTDCGAKFISKTIRDRHAASIHTKKFPFNCDTCGKGFLQKYRMTTHIMERHQGIHRPKDKICSYCGKGFKERQFLKIHMRTHTGEKPYQCKFCPWRFTQGGALRTHVRALHIKRGAIVEGATENT